MKIKLKVFTALLLLCTAVGIGQEKLEPTILVLSPSETNYHKSFEKELAEINSSLAHNGDNEEVEDYLSSPEFLSEPENIQQMVKSEVEYSKNLDFFKTASTISEQYLAYRFYEKFPNLLIKLKDKTSDGSIQDLRSMSQKENLQYVLNYSEIDLFKKGGIGYARINIQLYDSISNSILLDQSYIGDWNNPGFEFACTNESISCMLNNALSEALKEIIGTISRNSPTLQKEKQLRQERLSELAIVYLNKDFNKQFLDNIVTEKHPLPFQILLNGDKTKFVAFFLEQVSPQDFQNLVSSKKDKDVQIISPNDIKDKEVLNEIPKTYAYILKGVKYNEKWFYEKSKVTYFQANSLKEGQIEYFNNLQDWNFFKENSTEFNEDFWETELFEKVPDLKKDPEWEAYGESMEADEINNRDYIGLYEIVANELKDSLQMENGLYEEQLGKLFQKKYDSLEHSDPKKYRKITRHSLIFPKERTFAINPVLIENENGKKTLHYFLLMNDSGDFYEWIYFEPPSIEGNFFGEDVVNQISGLTQWNFSVNNLNDAGFWKDYVFKKENNDYRYLNKLE